MYTSLLWSQEVHTYFTVVVKTAIFNMYVECIIQSLIEEAIMVLSGFSVALLLCLQYDLRTSIATKLSRCMSFSANRQPPSSIRLNTIVIDPRSPNHLAVGGSDEYARVYDIRKFLWDESSNPDTPVNLFCPNHLMKTRDIRITGLAYSNTSELLVSYNDEHIYLFQKNMGLGPSPHSASVKDLQKPDEPEVYLGHRNSRTIKGVSFFGPDDDYVLSGSDCGHIFIWRKKGAKLVRMMIGDQSVVNHLEPHPHMPFIATCGFEKDVKLWTPTATDVSPLPDNVAKVLLFSCFLIVKKNCKNVCLFTR